MRKLTLSLLVSFLAITPAACSAPLPPSKQVDQLLEKWDKPGMPGAAVAVIQDGKIVYRRGVGMANIEHDAPNKPTTVFHVASMSKQFTAFAVHLLAQDGKLSLGDDIRKHLPEMRDFGKVITIAQLIHHTSGLRDQWNLLAMAGWRLEDVITEDDVFRLLQRQQSLNFAPGREFAYSNTGYTLLALIVKRVSGKALPAFAQERIFGPLGMKHTHFHDNYGTLVKGRAMSYDPLPAGGYQYIALSYSNVGATSLFTTVEDLALWDRNFYDGKVGGKALLADVQKVGTLAGGRPLRYAAGLDIDKYRGLNVVQHAGGDAGYRSQLVRFPDQRFSVAVLANAGDFDFTALVNQVADIYLAKQLGPKPAGATPAKQPAPAEVAIDPAKLDAFVGAFALAPQFVITFTKENGQLMAQATGQPKYRLAATGERAFFLKAADARFIFDAPAAGGVVASGVLHQHGRAMPAKRVERATMSMAEARAFEGEYYSDELHVLYTMAAKDGKLTLSFSRGQVALDKLGPTSFNGDYPFGRVEYQCRDGEGCTGFTISNGRVRNLQFTKVHISAAGAAEASRNIAALAPLAPEPAPPFATQAVYVRGSMNGWSLANKLEKAGNGRFEAKLVLDKGRHEFKVGSEDFQQIDFGAFHQDQSIALGKPKRLEAVGANMVIEAPAKATYAFVLDTAEPRVPQISVSVTP
ncbi:serine hydrolase [Massilia glaciei]|uniref:Aminopeptidase n=1 Tax=Massilia glaciei TaxID=1524097 RepID=A0A2U2HM59_9BURK|nr:serine hydrolase [Massilia glaciei]PWF48590.1 aminopeptidase [Massilia glaciei]